MERVSAIARIRGVALSTPRMDERLDVGNPAWWRSPEAQMVLVGASGWRRCYGAILMNRHSSPKVSVSNAPSAKRTVRVS